MQKSISIVIPIHNEEENIPLIYRAVESALRQLPAYAHEVIFVNDGSIDGSQKIIDTLSAKDSTVRGIEFTRNFGKEAATTAGIRKATGDAVICIDADLQHPPALIPEFVKHWENGAEVVVGMRSSNQGEGVVKRYGSKLFYAIMSRISETDITPGETDFRLLDRSVVEAFSELNERGRTTRLLINWLGFKKATVSFAAPARANGDARYSFSKLFHLALNSLTANTLFPLRAAGYLGLVIAGSSFLLALAVFIEQYIFGDALSWHFTGAAQIAILNAFLIGVVLMALGVIAIYVGRTSEEVSRRPLYVVRKSHREKQ
jgi:dolichol-phosphate mannosyltransferase